VKNLRFATFYAEQKTSSVELGVENGAEKASSSALFSFAST